MTDGRSAENAAWGDTEREPRNWSSGDWEAQLRGDELADIRFLGTPMLRSIRAVARDRDWETVPNDVLALDTSGGRVALRFRMRGLGADLAARLEITAVGSVLRASFHAVSGTDFPTNRTGLVVLHPAAVAGTALQVLHPDGSSTDTAFPVRISPNQPAEEIAELRWATEGVDARLTFDGDVFEMEDQRNWTDASFKTYSRPLALPFPVTVTTGEVIEQSVELACASAGQRARTTGGARRTHAHPLRLETTDAVVPSITLGATTGTGSPAAVAPDADALLVELDAHGSWRTVLERARAEASGVPLDVRIVAHSPDELEPVVTALTGTDVVRLAVYDATTHVTEPALWDALVSASTDAISADLVGGSRAHFTELNRTHDRLPHGIPALTFSLTPQMHARERAQLLESIPMQRRVALDAVAIARGRPVHVGPVTLRPRFNAVATSAAGNTSGSGDTTDARQTSLAMRAWVVASAAALAVDGVASICYLEASGPRGIRALTGEPYPVATAIGWLHELSGRPFLSAADAPADVWVLGAEADRGSGRPGAALLANLRCEPIALELRVGGASHPIELAALSAARVPLPPE